MERSGLTSVDSSGRNYKIARNSWCNSRYSLAPREHKQLSLTTVQKKTYFI